MSTGSAAFSLSPAEDPRPIDETCPCPACKRGREGFTSRARLHALARGPDPATAAQLVTLHNICYMLRLSRAMRRAVVLDQYPQFAEAFLREYYPRAGAASSDSAGRPRGGGGSKGSAPEGAVPLWAREALTAAGIAGPGREWLLASEEESSRSGDGGA